jgi:hypothetical protein
MESQKQSFFSAFRVAPSPLGRFQSVLSREFFVVNRGLIGQGKEQYLSRLI